MNNADKESRQTNGQQAQGKQIKGFPQEFWETTEHICVLYQLSEIVAYLRNRN